MVNHVLMRRLVCLGQTGSQVYLSFYHLVAWNTEQWTWSAIECAEMPSGNREDQGANWFPTGNKYLLMASDIFAKS